MAAAFLLSACSGMIGDGAVESPPGRQPDPSVTPSATPGEPLRCQGPSLPAPRIWRLGHDQFANTLQSALRLATSPDVSSFPADPGDLADDRAISPILAQYYWEAVSKLATGLDLAAVLPCTPVNADDEACVTTFIGSFGRTAWRRPLSIAEVDGIRGTYRTLKASSGGTVAVRAVVKRMLLSPNFLYRTELGGDEAPGRPLSLTPHELASELSYLVWNRPPDATLAAAADDGSLLRPERLRAELDRMLASNTSAKGVLTRYFERWLGLDHLADAAKDPKLFPMYSRQLMDALGTESRMLVEETLWKGDGTLKSLLTASHTYANATTARLYGATLSGSTMQRITPNPSQRLGILTHPSVWSVHSESAETGVPRRGRFVAEQLLCFAIPEPPPNVPAFMQSATSNLSSRQQWERHRNDPSCAVCHQFFDPQGLALENYDALGAYRTKDGTGRTIDATGEIKFAADQPGVAVKDGVDFIRQLAGRDEPYQCFTRRYFREAFGRIEQAGDECAVEAMNRAFTTSGTSMKALVAAVVGSDVFHLRQTPNEGGR